MNWDDVRLFLAVAEEGSFRKGATKLDVGHSTLSRRIEALETELGIKLFNRVSTGLELTPAGEEMRRTASPMEMEFSQLQVRLFGRDAQPKGPIYFTAPSLIVNHVLMGPLTKFCELWPDIDIHIDNSLDRRNLATREADVALRMTNQPDNELIGRKVGTYCEAAYASDAYLQWYLTEGNGVHRWLYPGDGYEFKMNLDPVYRSLHKPKPLITIPDPEGQAKGAQMGGGLATLPCVIGSQLPELKRISDVVDRSDIWLLAHKDTRANRRMQLFRDFLVEVLADKQEVLRGENSLV